MQRGSYEGDIRNDSTGPNVMGMPILRTAVFLVNVYPDI